MKKSLQYLIALSVAALTACSSMEVSEAESVEENFPKDFVAAEYVELHPELISLQIRDYVKAYNGALILEKDSIQADTAAFMADTASLHQIFVNPKYAGFSEDLWNDEWEAIVTTKEECEKQIDTIKIVLEVYDAVGDSIVVTSVYLDSAATTPSSTEIQYTDGKISKIIGYLDETRTGALETFIIDSGKVDVSSKGIQRDTIDINCVEVADTTVVGIPRTRAVFLKYFNFNDTRDDLEKLAEIPLDTFALTYQYVVYGKAKGFAYRKCKDSELNNKAQIESDIAGKLFCAAGDKILEISGEE